MTSMISHDDDDDGDSPSIDSPFDLFQRLPHDFTWWMMMMMMIDPVPVHVGL
jgi:hypothetical protein